ncbi:MAG: argininosuccinate synthase [Algoriphagus sp.]|uniref:argininosuccinate synthase n=1 Tax=Algoriphagus sp. TaxID=1872435 RepID=UPI002721EFF0|nr:argininosuccinate synthase domain-containing protein [Algoriphagus sp.]MDO8967794.1 argininosuccinate synthase [Algoriphagus sp.]MDP2041958.1 argininosuccinate synthase [Algoriphagus sp.]MDP3201239.1 argininosuccinate synthase [Algoriphagus sp.]MDP3471056.1 argininosuccinate synthase [Algoriphagus sp.]
MKKVVLAYSGGLDTTFCALHLTKDLGYEVHAVIVNTGGFSKEELATIEARAKTLGVASFHILEVLDTYYQEVIKFLVFGNVLKNATYPLSVSAERILQAKSLAEYAKSIGAKAVAHGSTGAGNDQVRFDMIFQTIVPDIEIITPIRDLKLSRQEEIEYLKKHGVSMNFEKAAYSINKGIWGTSVGGKETLTSSEFLPEEAWPTQVTETSPKEIKLTFVKGELKGVDGVVFENPVDAIQKVQAMAAPYGIGRDIHVGDTIIGIKGRVGFEAAAPIIIIKGHQLLEKHTLTKWQMFWKNQLSEFYGNHLHEGHYLDPVMRNLEAFLEDTQKYVTGDVRVLLQPYRFTLLGIKSDHDLMSSKFGSYGEMNKGYTGEDVKGFTRILGNQTSIFHKVNSHD